MLERMISGALNHLLDREEWARARLQPFAGRSMCIESMPFSFVFSIDTSGFLVPASERTKTDVLIRLPDDTLPRFLTDRERIFAAANVSGTADIAETLGFVFRYLRWDTEADLARLTGDIAARRIMRGLRSLADVHRRGVRRFAENLVEYATDERRVLIRPQTLITMSSEIEAIVAVLAQLEDRVSQLEQF